MYSERENNCTRIKMSQQFKLRIEMRGRGEEQLTNQQTEEEEIKRMHMEINDSVILPLYYFSPKTEKGSISTKRLKISEASWITESVLKERNRRDQMSANFSVLQSMVPSLSHESKCPREKIISDTVDYIKHLQKEAERLEGLTKFQCKDQTVEKPILSKCANQNSSVKVTVSNGATFLTIQRPFRRGLVLDIVKLLEKNQAEVLEARFSLNDQRLITFTATVRLGSGGGSTIDKIREELLTL